MRPSVEQILDAVIAELDRVADAPSRATLRSARHLLESVQAEFDSCVVSRLDVIQSHERIFSLALELPLDEALRDRLRDALSLTDPDLRVSTLDRHCEALGERLIDLHAWLEASDHPGAAPVLEEIWQFLTSEVARRADDRVFTAIWQ